MSITPLFAEIPYVSPQDALERFYHDSPVLLESTLRSERGRYSFLAIQPFEVITYCAKEKDRDIFSELKSCLSAYPLKGIPKLPPFQGGMVGYWGYELAGVLEKIPRKGGSCKEIPDLLLGLYDLVIAWDQVLQKSFIFSSGYPEKDEKKRLIRAKERLETTLCQLKNPSQKRNQIINNKSIYLPQIEIKSNYCEKTYQETVRFIQRAISKGDIFQANLSQRFELAHTDIHPLEIYARLSKMNPAPFAGFLSLGGVQLISASPERLISLEGRRVEACPIKGTIRRSEKSSEDRQLMQQLKDSVKDRAENIMIVDLLRNDLSRVCLPHHVKVTKLCHLESYATVHHLVSEIQGVLAEQWDAIDLIKATFPGGSVTGAPKIRAMEIIAELETVERGPYCGSMGYIGFNGDMDLSILIRTFVMHQSFITFHAGGAITLASDPQSEYEETLLKIASLKKVLSI